MTPEQAAALREPFPPEAIGSLPRAGTMLSFVGHAGVTDRALQVDAEWTWEPFATDEAGLPLIAQRGKDSVLWIRLTIAGVTRPGVGIVASGSFELEKQLISDAIRNAAMRFGVALDLWSKEDLRAHDENAEGAVPQVRAVEARGTTSAAPPATSPRPLGESAAGAGDASQGPAPDASPAVSKVRRENLKARCVALGPEGVSIADEREKHKLPLVDSCNPVQLAVFETMVDALEHEVAARKEREKTNA